MRPTPESYQGPCKIHVQPHYYDRYDHPPYYWRNEDREIVIYPTRAAAEAAVEAYYNAPSVYEGIAACSVLAHGQAGAHTLTICRATAAEGKRT